MSMQPAAWPEPDPRIAAAIAAKYPGKRPRPLAVLIRDQLGQWLRDEDFAVAFGTRGRPGWSPSRLALVTVLQRAENLTDRQAAESVRIRIDWQYLLGLPLDDPGFDHTVLAEFRDRVAGAGLEQVVLDALLEKLAAGGLVKAGGKQRTDSTHVTAAVAALNRLELAGESVRAALEALTAAHPAWVKQRVCVADFTRRYGTPMTSWRPPVSQARRDELAIAYARDGHTLLEAVYNSAAPAWLRELPAVDVLRRVLLQNYTRTARSICCGVRGGSTAMVGTCSGTAPLARSRSQTSSACSLVRGTSTRQPNSGLVSNQDSAGCDATPSPTTATAGPLAVSRLTPAALRFAATVPSVPTTVCWSVVVPFQVIANDAVSGQPAAISILPRSTGPVSAPGSPGCRQWRRPGWPRSRG